MLLYGHGASGYQGQQVQGIMKANGVCYGFDS